MMVKAVCLPGESSGSAELVVAERNEPFPAWFASEMRAWEMWDGNLGNSMFRQIWEGRSAPGGMRAIVSRGPGGDPLAVAVATILDEQVIPPPRRNDKKRLSGRWNGSFRLLGAVGFYTRPDFRGQGLGGELAAATEECLVSAVLRSGNPLAPEELPLVCGTDDALRLLRRNLRWCHAVSDRCDCVRRRSELSELDLDLSFGIDPVERRGPRGTPWRDPIPESLEPQRSRGRRAP